MPERHDRIERPARGREDPPTIPDTAREDSEQTWGDDPSTRDEEWYRRERPPHHE